MCENIFRSNIKIRMMMEKQISPICVSLRAINNFKYLENLFIML